VKSVERCENENLLLGRQDLCCPIFSFSLQNGGTTEIETFKPLEAEKG